MSAKINLQTSDGQNLEADPAILRFSSVIAGFSDVFADRSMKLARVDSKSMQIILDWISHYKHKAVPVQNGSQNVAKDMENVFDERFLQMDLIDLQALSVSADYLGINFLTKLVCKHISHKLNEKSQEEFRKHFGIYVHDRSKAIVEETWYNEK